MINKTTQNSRSIRVGDLICGELNAMIASELKDPGVRYITITRVRITKDLRQARVYYTVLIDHQKSRDAALALRRAKPFLKRKLGLRLKLRYVPELTFFYDDSIEQQNRLARLFDMISTNRTSTSDHSKSNNS